MWCVWRHRIYTPDPLIKNLSQCFIGEDFNQDVQKPGHDKKTGFNNQSSYYRYRSYIEEKVDPSTWNIGNKVLNHWKDFSQTFRICMYTTNKLYKLTQIKMAATAHQP